MLEKYNKLLTIIEGFKTIKKYTQSSKKDFDLLNNTFAALIHNNLQECEIEKLFNDYQYLFDDIKTKLSSKDDFYQTVSTYHTFSGASLDGVAHDIISYGSETIHLFFKKSVLFFKEIQENKPSNFPLYVFCKRTDLEYLEDFFNEIKVSINFENKNLEKPFEEYKKTVRDILNNNDLKLLNQTILSITDENSTLKLLSSNSNNQDIYLFLLVNIFNSVAINLILKSNRFLDFEKNHLFIIDNYKSI